MGNFVEKLDMVKTLLVSPENSVCGDLVGVQLKIDQNLQH